MDAARSLRNLAWKAEGLVRKRADDTGTFSKGIGCPTSPIVCEGRRFCPGWFASPSKENVGGVFVRGPCPYDSSRSFRAACEPMGELLWATELSPPGPSSN